MVKRYKTHKKLYLFNMIVFIGSAFDFFIRGEELIGIVLIFNGIINLLAYQRIPRRVASITLILNLFNALIATVLSYNYGEIDYVMMFFVWTALSIAYSFATLRQLYSIAISKSSRKRRKRKIS